MRNDTLVDDSVSTKKHAHTPADKPPGRFCPNHPGARGLHPWVRSCAPTDETKTSPAGNTKNPLDDSARIARGLGGYTRGCACAHPPSRQKTPQTILPKSPGGLGAPVGFINPGSLADGLPKQWFGPNRPREAHGPARIPGQQAGGVIQSPIERPGRGGTAPVF